MGKGKENSMITALKLIVSVKDDMHMCTDRDMHMLIRCEVGRAMDNSYDPDSSP